MGASGDRQRIGLALVLVATLFTLFVGFAHKSLCLAGDGFNANAYRFECYNDLVPLYRQEGFDRGALPFVDAPNEYPVGSALLMWSASLVASSEGGFFLANAVLLAGLALGTSWLLVRAAGDRALFFALAPTLALYAFLNWDLLAVAAATAATVAFLRRRDALAGLLIGLGVAAKLYPVLLLLPFVLERRREGDRRAAVRIGGWAAATWILVDLPFALIAFDRWTEVFRFNAARAVDWATLWFAGCRTLTGRLACDHVRLVNALSLVAFVAVAVLVWRATVRRHPDVPRWTLGFPLVVAFLLTTKVYSPQYSLWLLPWFALVLPEVRLFVAFEIADLAVFVTEFSWLGRHFAGDGLPVWPLEIAVVARAVVLVVMIVAFVRRPTASGVAGVRTPRLARA